MTTEALNRAIDIAGNPRQLAERISEQPNVETFKPAYIWNWLNRDGRVGAGFVIALCAAVDYQVTPHQVRPDLYPNPDDALPAELRQTA